MSEPQMSPTVLLTSPSPESIEEQELDVELVPPQAVNIGITQRAAEVRFMSIVIGVEIHGPWGPSNCAEFHYVRTTPTPRFE